MTLLTLLPPVLLVLFIILAFRWRHPVAEGRTILRLFVVFAAVLAVLAIVAQFVRPAGGTFPYVGEDAIDKFDRVYGQVVFEKDPDAVPEDQILTNESFAFSGDSLTVRADETTDEFYPIQVSVRNGSADEMTVTVFRPAMLVNGYDVSEALLPPLLEVSEDGKTITFSMPPQELNFRKISAPDLPLFSDDDSYSTYHRLPIFLITLPDGVEVLKEGHVDLIES